MNRKEFLDSLKNISIDVDVEEKVSKVYKDVPETILKILTKYSTPELFDENESRTLSLNEVIHAEEDNNISFQSSSLIPIADFGDNNYIVYNSSRGIWCMYNILDETLFKEEKTFEKLFLG